MVSELNMNLLSWTLKTDFFPFLGDYMFQDLAVVTVVLYLSAAVGKCDYGHMLWHIEMPGSAALFTYIVLTQNSGRGMDWYALIFGYKNELLQ